MSWIHLKQPELAVPAAAAAAFLVCFLVTPFVRRLAVRGGWVARPAASRWKQQRVVARLGGIGIDGEFEHGRALRKLGEQGPGRCHRARGIALREQRASLRDARGFQ